MKKPLFDAKWIRIGFNLGIGIFLAVASCYSLMMLGTVGILTTFGFAQAAGPGVFTYSVSLLAILGVLLLLVFIPAFIGKSIAQTINFFRFRKIASVPNDSKP